MNLTTTLIADAVGNSFFNGASGVVQRVGVVATIVALNVVDEAGGRLDPSEPNPDRLMRRARLDLAQSVLTSTQLYSAIARIVAVKSEIFDGFFDAGSGYTMPTDQQLYDAIRLRWSDMVAIFNSSGGF